VNATLPQHYEARPAQSDPSKVALVTGDDRVTHGELECDSNRLARLLIDQGCRRGDRVRPFTPKSLAAIVAMHATLKARAAYVPIDPQGPAPRIAKILSAAEPALALVAPQAAPVIDDLVASGQLRARVGSLRDATVAGERVTGAFALTRQQTCRRSGSKTSGGPGSTAHILFTSG
jgi:non-ribosomal peptide synthetase component F